MYRLVPEFRLLPEILKIHVGLFVNPPSPTELDPEPRAWAFAGLDQPRAISGGLTKANGG